MSTRNISKYFTALFLLGAAAATAQPSTEADWQQSKNPTVNGRALEIVHHDVKKEWGYPEPQQDTYIVVHPRNERKNAPLYVVLHSAGHDVFRSVECTRHPGDHDIYRAPEGCYALYLDCRADHGDWWWGGSRDKGRRSHRASDRYRGLRD